MVSDTKSASKNPDSQSEGNRLARAEDGRFAKGNGGGPGRKKGVPNKVTADIRAMIVGALEDVGGRDYLARQAEENPVAFLGLVGKVVPKDHRIEGGTLEEIIARSWLRRGDGADRN